ncbi:unnamed protein product [Nesidiocoris tenuis]|uniref:Uncharacterized protein n=1 Tax=Nesidiocoris tenuis TaxID=355587 RepID=A0A6H5H4R3_9HEMI|nr:unnamed protein product [Nesidiocoris tenuis]
MEERMADLRVASSPSLFTSSPSRDSPMAAMSRLICDTAAWRPPLHSLPHCPCHHLGQLVLHGEDDRPDLALVLHTHIVQHISEPPDLLREERDPARTLATPP